MEDKKKVIIAVVSVLAIVAAVGFVAMQAMNGGGAQVKEPESYSTQPPGDAERYRGNGGTPSVDPDRM